jgi:hypothetical protein
MLRTTKHLLLTSAIALALTTLPSRPSAAQFPQGPPCYARAEVVDLLNKSYGEHLVARGLSGDTAVMEVFAGPEGNWTMVVTTPAGVSCFIAVGSGWEAVEPPDTAAREHAVNSTSRTRPWSTSAASRAGTER